MNNIKSIPFSETHLFSKLILDYISNDEKAMLFSNYDLSIDSIEQIIHDKKKENIDRKVLVEAINKQYANIKIPSLVSDNIKLLE
ncbi:MAG TPA: bacillithiol biosynthesis BshC, partial [Chitinophagales bacterium]|nr:bacillithiol biosynthesis BshC [Chitinophagales bacterium]